MKKYHHNIKYLTSKMAYKGMYVGENIRTREITNFMQYSLRQASIRMYFKIYFMRNRWWLDWQHVQKYAFIFVSLYKICLADQWAKYEVSKIIIINNKPAVAHEPGQVCITHIMFSYNIKYFWRFLNTTDSQQGAFNLVPR